jgi:hypothetical protein
MARKTNYAFDRNNRAKAKAAKREAKRQAKLAAKAEKAAGTSAQVGADDALAQTGPATDGHDEINSDN